MTVDEFRSQKIKNTRLAWEVYGNKIPVEEYTNFTTTELKTILLLETGKTAQHLTEALESNQLK